MEIKKSVQYNQFFSITNLISGLDCIWFNISD